ncbi:hypothetical protein GIB67_026463 [Kingdonia uniflora]|uniref:Uncharacterized protein n=1 Tax=Kingdonia uniflora TaxID=39325 RepID=A0A7J7P6A2_9MAGN|nr:hypothetical protein GIB67_026463 [Kingdonia uniflora]
MQQLKEELLFLLGRKFGMLEDLLSCRGLKGQMYNTLGFPCNFLFLLSPSLVSPCNFPFFKNL